MTHLSVPNWADFQHYKDRDPPWIKLHRQLLGNYEFSLLEDAVKAHLMLIWLLAARHGNRIPNDAEWIGRQIAATQPVDVDALVGAGLLEVTNEGPVAKPARKPTSTLPADQWGSRYITKVVKELVWERDEGKCQLCGAKKLIEYDHRTPVSMGGDSSAENIWLLCRSCNRRKRIRTAEQVATQNGKLRSDLRSLEAEAEAEAEERQIMSVTGPALQPTDVFEEAWVLYPKRPNNSKAKARSAWNARVKEGVAPADMVAGVCAYAEYVKREGTEPRYIKLASTFFGPDRHWETDYTSSDTMITVYDENGEWTPEAARLMGVQW